MKVGFHFNADHESLGNFYGYQIQDSAPYWLLLLTTLCQGCRI